MKSKIKYAISIILICIFSLLVVNVVEGKKDDVVKGNITVWADSSTFEYLNKSAQEFMELNSRTKVDVVQIYSDNLNEKFKAAIEGGTLPDVAQLNSKYIREIREKYQNVIPEKQDESIIEDYTKNYTKGRISEVKEDGKVIGIPFTSRPLVMYLREDMLKIYGYTYENIVTWEDLINMGKDIYAKSGGKVNVLNAVGQDYCDLVSLLIMQEMELTDNEEEIKSNVDKRIAELTNDNILNKNREGQFVARISSINGMRELKEISENCQWTSNNVPAKSKGSNRFYLGEGDNLVVLDKNDKNQKLTKKFIEYLSTNTKSKSEYILNGNFFLSFLSAYENKSIEGSINNFIDKNPIVVMDNISRKAPTLDDYDLYFKIRNYYN
ncbi:ABC transporter substrate-binding protein [Clostridium cibarium]|uniref:Carbohydrate ABC transporter substrate-binding protein n=1 Tax=Clostridium cibarium TaxID=2762247 RepID=A0ABR8PWP8_9CLOT|nr:ABC transporter substrate-binding protein [Clostridium cibarium]MBD7912613.1 carbohydrate ABC transporter substrate-binding protein [Clostridium cibarium]